MIDVPAAIIALTVWTYWSCVAMLVVRSQLRFRTAAGSLPQMARERWMWLIWGPTIVMWLTLPLWASFGGSPLATWPRGDQHASAFFVIRCVASGVGVVALLLTVPCWLGMGRDWSMAIVPNKRSRLITSGMFGRVRHPIYTLSMLLMAATVVAVPNAAMVIVGIVHCGMLYQKAVSEEKFLRRVHGQDYAEYARRTNRFFPRVFSPRPEPGDKAANQRRIAA